jgi:hypothetical protein
MDVLGLLLGMIGTDVTSGPQRFCFGVSELADGLGFVSLAMGLFGIRDIISSLEKREKRDILKSKLTGLWPSRRELREAAPAVPRGTLGGSLLGILPGGYLMGHPGDRNTAYGMQDGIDLVQVDWDGRVVWQFNRYEDIEDPGEEPQWMGRQQHDYQREGNPVGYYAPGMEPLTGRGRTLILSHKNLKKPKICNRLLLDATIIEVTAKHEIVWEYITPYRGKMMRINMIYRAFRVPYEWVPQAPRPAEIPIEPVEVTRYRLPGTAQRGARREVHVPGMQPYWGDEALCVQTAEEEGEK